MPEEKKKESFTFSDKIKSTQASGANKSFANRFTSKIGSDGKPRQTLFERTKRDAPFFIAALVALLLLPFLYKYSGQVEEDTPMVSPGYEDAIINPDRSGFDFSGDADGQISQLSGRDSMDLIVGWGKRHNEEEADASLADFYRSGLSDSSAKSDASSYKRSDMDEETNITNIYKRQRKQAPAQTRAAFRRAATKIGNLKGAGLTGRGGGRLGIGHFGGGLKAAAQKVRGPGQVNSTKPVSLQPLQAAGKPSRSYFGQGAAQEARRSKDAMSKGNAMQALMDAQMKPVEPGRIGGLASGDFGGPGGGPGGLQRNFNYNGKEPWWWDMMKQRAQMEWQLWFDLKKSWIEFGSKLAQHWVEGLLNCLVMGDSDGDVDHFLGSGGGGGGAATCCGKKEGWFAVDPELGPALKNAGSLENFCKGAIIKRLKAEPYKLTCANKEYKPGSGGGASVRLSGWQQRWACMGGHISAYAAGAPEIGLNTACSQLSSNHQYSVYPMGKARKWTKNTYHYIVARNYLPKAMEDFIHAHGGHVRDSSRNLRLCDEASDKLQGTGDSSGGIRSYNDLDQTALDQRKELIEARDKCLEKKDKTTNQEIDCSKEIEELNKFESEHFKVAKSVKKKTNPNARYQEEEVDPETLADSCVIYVGQGPTLEWNLRFKPELTALLRDIAAQYAPNATADGLEQVAKRSFGQLDLLMISSMMAEEPLGTGGVFGSGHSLKKLPMAYWRFKEAYLDRYGVTTKENGIYHHKVYKRKYRTEGEDVVYGATCMFDNSVKLDCEPNSNPAKATLEINKEQYKAGVVPINPSELVVKAAYVPLAMVDGFVPNFQIVPMKEVAGSASYTMEFRNVIDRSGNKQDKPGVITWHVYRSGELITMDECDYKNAGDGQSVTVEEKDCPKGAQTNAACCAQAGANDNVYNYKWAGDKCVITPKTNPNPDQDPNRDPNQDPNRDPSVEATAFAQSISWVPNNPQDRKAVTAQNPLSASTFSGPLVKTYPHRADGSSCPGCQGQQFCDDLFGYKMDSKKATEFVTKVRDAYNKKYQNNANVLPIRFGADYPTDGEFMDALQIAARENLPGLERVSTAAVCELGRDFTRMSKDKHAGARKMTSATGQKGEERYYHNELGSYLAYIHDTSVLYPDAYVTVDGQQVCDWRFQPKGLVGGGCPSAMGIEMGKGYAYNNYNGTKFNNLDQYRKSLTSTMRSAPLKDLVQGHSDLPHDCQGNTQGCRKISGKNYVSTYNSFGPNGFAGLIKDQGGSGNGTACEAFTGNSTMAVADVLRYIQGVCSAGLDYKPKGMGKAEYKPGQTPTSDGGAPGSDNSD